MNTITRVNLLPLIASEDGHFVSIYMPAEVVIGQRPQNLARFKNLLQTAEEKLIEHGMRSTDARTFLAAGHKLLDEAVVWASVSQGFVAFFTPSGMRFWHLPFTCEEACIVGRRVHVLPLLPHLADEINYFVLAVSQNQVRLLHGTQDQLDEVAVPNLPTSMREALNYDTREGAFQVHSGQPQVGGKESMVFHGQGGEVDVHKKELQEYLRIVDRAVAGLLRERAEPLVFAGVDYLFPIYHGLNTYPHLLGDHVSGNPELLSTTDLRERAWRLVESLHRACRDAAVAKYWDLVAHARATNRIEDIVIAAYAGAVETLFITPGTRRWGAFKPESARVRIDERRRRDSEDLINLAAALVLRNNGAVEPIASGNIPGGGVMAAVLRYEFPPSLGETATVIGTPG